MSKAPIPENESQRIEALLGYNILDTEAEEAFDNLTRLASYICNIPIALISFIDHDRQWCKSHIGLTTTENSRDSAFCSYTILQSDLLVVPDLTQDPRFANNPFVTGYPGIRFYAGAPLTTAEGLALGSICVMDHVPRTLTCDQLETLKVLAQQIVSQLELRKTVKQLGQVNLKLDRATKLKDEFLANMSHELRSPLNAILGMSESLKEEICGPLNERQRKMVTTIERSGEHLLELINDILDLSKIESGHLELELADVSIQKFCESSLMFVRQAAFNKQITLDSYLSNAVEDFHFDERRMRQVLINLLNNAVKFTAEKGYVQMEITVRRPDEILKQSDGEYFTSPNPYLCISVRDTGIGISSENQERLFQPFVQIDSNLNRQYQGTGLGLALSQRIVNLHGGWITLDSQLGQGSCFTIYLPQPKLIGTQHRAHSSPSVCNDEIGLEIPLETVVHGSPLVLLAEDNEANEQTLVSYLEAKGYQVVMAHDGYQAVAIAQAQTPDLILMDIQMPKMDGLEAIHQIRQHSPLEEVPIIALTALTLPGDQERCLNAGANIYLSKPIQMKALVSVMQTLLKST
ncbi:ATP-binding protein [Leptolyngbya sp. PL-A3]|uniref:hybrid sensor histidine kinase/response regulator n=1 Tax=Leptolyngbya sp. PL-A3 TaxID=2933911 RepID=UPI00329A0E29